MQSKVCLTCCAGHQCGPGAGRDHCQDFDSVVAKELSSSTIGGEIEGGDGTTDTRGEVGSEYFVCDFVTLFC